MNLLTDQCKTEFEKWLTESNHTPWTVFFDSLPDTVKNAYYLEFFDLHDIFVTIEYHSHLKSFSCEVKGKFRTNLEVMKKRQECLREIIIICNSIYNDTIHTNNNG